MLVYLYAFVSSLGVSVVLTALMRRLALRWRALDHPGERKMQSAPVPLLGGVAIVGTFFLILVLNLLLLQPVRAFGIEWLELHVFAFLGTDHLWKLGGLALGGLVLAALGLVDDLRTLRPEQKLVGQIVAGLLVVCGGIRLELFLPEILPSPWMVTLVSGAVTLFWILMMTNAMNFLDNMDGLCAGVALLAAVSLFACVAPLNTFVSVQLAVFAGAVAGFLYHNFNPAKIYMGDTGSMFCGYLLATSSVLATFYTEGTPSRVAVAAPLLALSVPIFDICTVVYIRWRNGESVMKGDKRHFSHRLVEMGMTPRQAVEFIYLVGFISGLCAVLLRQVSFWGTTVILVQVAGVYGMIVLLMQAARNLKEPGP
jgi:UDP-GlcNAc:undecaprenyl-phosphate/decaprenyl-phosphate GlcNAc-1-phosphate transferase